MRSTDVYLIQLCQTAVSCCYLDVFELNIHIVFSYRAVQEKEGIQLSYKTDLSQQGTTTVDVVATDRIPSNRVPR